MSHALGWLRQKENQYLAVPQEMVRELPVKLQELLGYAIHRPNLGFVDGLDPKTTLRSDSDEFSGFEDFLPERYLPALEQYREQQLRQQGAESHQQEAEDRHDR